VYNHKQKGRNYQMEDILILVNELDEPCGQMEKLKAHQVGALHRAFSVFIFNSKGELLLQQRAKEKYHSSGLWTNTCCSHPRIGEEMGEATHRRLSEEMGITCPTTFAFSFLYNAVMENGLIEHEFDHVYFGNSDEIPVPEKSEVQAWRYISLKDLRHEITESPENFTAWLAISLDKVVEIMEVSTRK
jgi:isopentenyl-diphosphate delta-isomerase